MTIDADASISGCSHELLYIVEIHIAIAIHATGHLHGVACNGLIGVFTDHILDKGVVEILGSNAQFEIRILLIIDVLLECLVFIQVSIIVIIRLSQLEFLLC